MAAALIARAWPPAARWWSALRWRRTAWASATVAKLQAPYTDGCWHWAAVLALHRVVVVAAYSLVPEITSRTVLQVIVSMFFLVLHTAARPFTNHILHHVQTALLSLLVVIALLNAPIATI